MILKRGLIPIQGDPEKMRSEGAVRRVANTHGERRSANRTTDPGVPERQRGDRLRGADAGGAVPMGAGRAGGSRVRRARQKTAGSGASLPEQGNRTEPGAG